MNNPQKGERSSLEQVQYRVEAAKDHTEEGGQGTPEGETPGDQRGFEKAFRHLQFVNLAQVETSLP